MQHRLSWGYLCRFQIVNYVSNCPKFSQAALRSFVTSHTSHRGTMPISATTNHPRQPLNIGSQGLETEQCTCRCIYTRHTTLTRLLGPGIHTKLMRWHIGCYANTTFNCERNGYAFRMPLLYLYVHNFGSTLIPTMAAYLFSKGSQLPRTRIWTRLPVSDSIQRKISSISAIFVSFSVIKLMRWRSIFISSSEKEALSRPSSSLGSGRPAPGTSKGKRHRAYNKASSVQGGSAVVA